MERMKAIVSISVTKIVRNVFDKYLKERVSPDYMKSSVNIFYFSRFGTLQ